MKQTKVEHSGTIATPNGLKPSRDEILVAALACFSARGFDGTSIADVARAASVGHPLVHYHFRNKDYLWEAMVEHAFGDLAKTFELVRQAAADLDPLSAIRLSLKTFARFCAKYPQHIDLLLIEGRSNTPRFSSIVTIYLKPLHELVDGLIAKAVAQGQIRNIPPLHLANMMVGAVTQFATARGLIEQLYHTNSIDSDLITYHADLVLDVALNGISLQPDQKR